MKTQRVNENMNKYLKKKWKRRINFELKVIQKIVRLDLMCHRWRHVQMIRATCLVLVQKDVDFALVRIKHAAVVEDGVERGTDEQVV